MTTDDQRTVRIDNFFAKHSAALARQGAVVPSWRWRGGRRVGPYFRLDVRDERGRKVALYLGLESSLVAAVRARLTQLHLPRDQKQQFAHAYRILGRAQRAARANLASELEKVGLRLQGSEIRGLARAKGALERAAGLEDLVQEQVLVQETEQS